MKTVSLACGRTFRVSKFDTATNKTCPYYQDGSRYAICPTCTSSVSIKNGKGNNVKSKRTLDMYASHTTKEVNGLNFNPSYKSCPNYTGNNNNWQKIYTANSSQKNLALETYINNHENEIVEILTEITGIRFWKWGKDPAENRIKIPSSLFNKLYSSFVKHRGLYCKYFAPDAVPVLLLSRMGKIDASGSMIESDKLKSKIESNNLLNDCIESSKFNPKMSQLKKGIHLVAAMNCNQDPSHLELKIEWRNDIALIKRINADFRKI